MTISAPSMAAPWLDKPQLITSLDIREEFGKELYKKGGKVFKKKYMEKRRFSLSWYLELCATFSGNKKKSNYKHEIMMKMTQSKSNKNSCSYLAVEGKWEEGVRPEFFLKQRNDKQKYPARYIYLLSDNFHWYLYLVGVGDGNILSLHAGTVIKIIASKDDVMTSIRCQASVEEYDECDDCYYWEDQGRDINEFYKNNDSIFQCIEKKLIPAGPDLIKWSPNNSACFIDYSMCINPKASSIPLVEPSPQVSPPPPTKPWWKFW